ncbi:Cytoplasmic dynein 2 light intermediate chain 1 [Dinochytrium kinnereticum]|nr:Cytoplasmic dynein 2 light intermediate chain 1 [Dinochytrium kinnereticum]
MLRMIAHLNGASILFSNLKDETSTTKARKLLNHYAFRANPLQEHSVDHNRPIVVIAGQDTLSQIGMPPSEIIKETVGKKGLPRYEQWKADFVKFFPQHPEEEHRKLGVDPFQFPEPAVDALRAQKE